MCVILVSRDAVAPCGPLPEVAAPWKLRSAIVRYTEAELEAAAEAVYRYRNDNLVEFGFDVRRNKVLIRVADPAEGLGSMQDRLPEPLDMFCLDSRPAVSEPAA